jgi:transposase
MTDGEGVPVAVVVAGANRADMKLTFETVDAVVVRTPNGRPRRPRHACLDKGYDYPEIWRGLRRRHITPHIARRGKPTPPRPRGGRARRWVVERTNSWHNRFRGLLVRWERKGTHYLALCQLACGLIAFHRAIA